ncbi:hypothetical protein AMOR_47540 [Anaeromyxobacter oryzae]|uniref:DNA-3-methyladenine glycosylase II n=1 Tax=Anaeromyxobacter oryzae TaxID=2918170 RepID=A0ABN6N1N6_9BACT|nr:hypothetical protein AMOR_47540 [Anaeromyxobacter oryzae]
MPLRPPFRLDLTVRLLQRLPAHPVEIRDAGRYVRAFQTPAGAAGWVIREAPEGGALAVDLFGAAGDAGPWVARIRRVLGLDVDLGPFHRRAARLPALAPIARAVSGVRPPRFAALHEAFASVIPFQQVSLAAAVATLRRVVLSLSAPVRLDGVVAWPFPSAEAFAAAPARVLRACGLSDAKARALQGACRAVADGALDEASLERLPTRALLERLREVPGIGPWSAALLALRGFGRLDVFPPGDAAAVRLLGGLGGEPLVERLGPWSGMLYYALFLRRMILSPEGASAGGGAPTVSHGR